MCHIDQESKIYTYSSTLNRVWQHFVKLTSTCILSSKVNLIVLQEKVAKTSCMSACKHVATSLLNFLMDNNVRQVSMGALQQFNLDLIQCERKSAMFRVNMNAWTK